MSGKVQLYDGEYGNFEIDVYRKVRMETYGIDYGQTSWVTSEESAEIPKWLGISADSKVLEIGCGSGAYALHLAETVGCDITGVDINSLGIRNATHLAEKSGLAGKLHFEVCDVSRPLPMERGHFDAVFANDVLCHIPGRAALIQEIYRVLKPGNGRVLFSDALVIGGIVSHEEIATRSSIGFYLFSPPGENERLLREAGFADVTVSDTTEQASGVALRWQQARERHKDKLVAAEGESTWAGLQRFLGCVRTLTGEKRLLRSLYQGRKP